MTANLYCSRADVNRELPLGAIVSPAGILASSGALSDTLSFDGHGLETNDEVTVRATEGGTLSAPLVAGTTYYAIRLTNSTFKLAATSGGSAINLTTDGVSMIVTREPRYDDQIEFYSRWVDAFFPSHIVPFGVTEAVHPTVKGIVARLAAKRLLNIGGQDSAIQTAEELAAKAQLERFAIGLPLRGAPAPARSNLAITATLDTVSDPRGWGVGGRLP